MEKILKLGGILNGPIFSKFDAAVKKLVALVARLCDDGVTRWLARP